MSNTASVTPYMDSGAAASGDVDFAEHAGARLLSRSAADRVIDERLAESRRVDRLSCNAVSLVSGELAPLIRAATELGYVPVKIAGRVASMRSTGTRVGPDGAVQLVNAQGDRLSMLPTGPSVRLEGSGSQAVVRQRTLMAVSRHLQQLSGGHAIARRAPDGSLHLTASELPARHGGGEARVAIVVDAAGNLTVDIDKVRGRRCENLLHGITTAIDGKVISKKIKPSYYDAEPGESARPRTRI